MIKRAIFLILYLKGFTLVAQQKDSLSIKNGIDNPNLLTTHHFGIFSSRINSNFKIGAPKHKTLAIDHTSGNNFHPFVEAHFPKNPFVRNRLSQIVWHDRSFEFIDQETTPADYMNIVIDAVIKTFRISLSMPLSKRHELEITLRSYLISKGKHPFSFFTGDETVEWFHSNISGGEDPFGRRFYGLNQVNFEYTDKNGNILKLDNNDFFIGGLELNHYYYPELTINKTRQLFINFGSHLGINTSTFNPSIDVGISTNAVKSINFKSKYDINIGTGLSLLYKNLIDFGTVIDLGNNPFLGTFEGNLEFVTHTKNGNYHSLSVNYQLQSRYSKKKEADYFRLLGKWQEINGGWQHGVTTLYKTLSNWSFVYTYGRPNFKIALYFKEDFLVNNAPDIQTGVNLSFPILK